MHDYPRSLCCCRGTAKLRASCSHQTGCSGRATPDTFHRRSGAKAQLLPLWRATDAQASQTYIRCIAHLFDLNRGPLFTHGKCLTPIFPLTLFEWEHHIRSELSDDSALITLFLFVLSNLPSYHSHDYPKQTHLYESGSKSHFPNINILEESFISVTSSPSLLCEVPSPSIIRHLCPWWLMILMSMCSHSLCHTLFCPLA